MGSRSRVRYAALASELLMLAITKSTILSLEGVTGNTDISHDMRGVNTIRKFCKHNVPRKQALHLLVVPDAVEDKHVKWAKAAPGAIEDLRCLGGNLTRK